MRTYKVYVEEGNETAFKYALESFDKNATIKSEKDHLLVETILANKEDLKFTMVKEVIPVFPIDVKNLNWWDREDDITYSADMKKVAQKIIDTAERIAKGQREAPNYVRKVKIIKQWDRKGNLNAI